MLKIISSEWLDFEWSAGEIAGKKYDKTSVCIKIAKDKFLQLDTGSSKSYLYSPEYNFPGVKELSFKLANNKILIHNFEVHETAKSEGKMIGTLGADYFENSILIIDFPNKKYLKVSQLKNELLPIDRIEWINGDVTDSLHITTTVKIGDLEFSPIIFDTGSSIFSLVLSKENWQKVVNKNDRLNPPLKLEVPAWGNTVRLYGAKAIAPVCMGHISVESDVYFVDDPKLDLGNQGVAGLVGNAILRDNYVLILDYKNKRIGTYKK